MHRVLIVEDDPDIGATIEFNLKQSGFSTHLAACGADALRVYAEAQPDLIILDLMLPDMSGVAICRHVRTTDPAFNTRVLMLTARGQEADRLLGFESGADDYITKPFSVRELIMRARAILRRNGDANANAAEKTSNGQDTGIVLDETSHRVFVGGAEVALTHTEFKLLQIFIERAGRVLSRTQLLHAVWKMQGNLVTRTVDTHVKRLREKLGPFGDQIETVRSVGYRYVQKGEAGSTRSRSEAPPDEKAS